MLSRSVSYFRAPDAPQRTAYFECTPDKNIPFTVEYEYDACVTYTMPDAAQVSSAQPNFVRKNNPPHIVLRPPSGNFVQNSAAERPIPSFGPAVLQILHRGRHLLYMRAFTILQIPEYAALNQKGTAAYKRCCLSHSAAAGIPARWQSGLLITPYSCGWLGPNSILRPTAGSLPTSLAVTGRELQLRTLISAIWIASAW